MPRSLSMEAVRTAPNPHPFVSTGTDQTDRTGKEQAAKIASFPFCVLRQERFQTRNRREIQPVNDLG